ncbi:uncharacterized protein PHALS_15288 [Plasmopara halstedii]|uniref:Uncharacterized protein n=1 Tax=Plasmopara halstedii TaxID=4781 RepID=A0A0N7L4A3_PLAHL|nr:uncharacterized protein PHALS_15288 [Plasmopara halstedii]CEG38115.1 hypothetical protein PHALS_15288 [Plasmopara halstedii]|eukprot:XP_024574484.1 hypothetical protein PHALS_15288 [Plasmopara halstedii]
MEMSAPSTFKNDIFAEDPAQLFIWPYIYFFTCSLSLSPHVKDLCFGLAFISFCTLKPFLTFGVGKNTHVIFLLYGLSQQASYHIRKLCHALVKILRLDENHDSMG